MWYYYVELVQIVVSLLIDMKIRECCARLRVYDDSARPACTVHAGCAESFFSYARKHNKIREKKTSVGSASRRTETAESAPRTHTNHCARTFIATTPFFHYYMHPIKNFCCHPMLL